MKRTLYIVFLLISLIAQGQVSLKVDTTHIRIGEQIQYELSTPKENLVVFPKLQLDSLGKIEVVHSLPVDTIKNKLYKKYILTCFDSGVYKIPKQDIVINNQHYFSDSLLIRVGTVAVDTTKQGLFPIKPIYKAAPKTWRDYLNYAWWLLGVLLLIVLIWWLIKQQRKTAKEKSLQQLSPIQEATEQLTSLDKKQLLEQQKIKEYYIELTDIVRNYIGKDVKIPTLEVTTDELITLLELHNKSNKLGIDKERIKELHQFLQHADLVKFAKAQPETFQIKEDRQTAETIIKEIQSIVHKPVLDEFGNPVVEETKEEKEAKIRKKRTIKGLLIGLALIILVGIATISYYGYSYVKDTLTGHPTKELLEGKWYYSSYGYPAISMESPKVLKAIAIPATAQNPQANTATGSFGYGSLLKGFYILVNTNEIQTEEELTLDMIVENAVQQMQNNTEIHHFEYEEEDTSVDGISGKIISGRFTVNNKKMFIKQFVFLQDHTVQQISIIYEQNDHYAKSITKRIEQSIHLEKIVNDDDDEN